MRRRAFTLAEVLLSLGTLAMVLVMAVGVLHFALQAHRRGEHSLRAAHLARQKLLEEQPGTEGSFPAPWQDYRYAMSQAATDPPGMVRVSVRVDGPAGARANLSLVRRERRRELILCVHDGSRWRLARAREEGGPRTLLPGTGGNDTQPTLSADGGTVVFASDAGGMGLWSVPADGSEPPTRLTALPPRPAGPSLSPGGLLAFTAPNEDGLGQLYVGPLAGGAVQQLTHLPEHVSNVCWSADGRQLAVVLDGTTIALLDPGGGVPRALVEADGWNTAPAFSPDGTTLAFMSNRDGNPELYCVKLSGGQLERLTRDPAYDTHPSWSSDGRRLLFQSNRGDRWRVWSMNPDGSDVRRLGCPEDEVAPSAAPQEGEPGFVPDPSLRGGF